MGSIATMPATLGQHPAPLKDMVWGGGEGVGGGRRGGGEGSSPAKGVRHVQPARRGTVRQEVAP